MNDQKVMNRWLVVVGAILIQLCLGAIYAWSVFTPPMKADKPGLVKTLSPQLLHLSEDRSQAWGSLKGAIRAAEAAMDAEGKKAAVAEFDTFAKEAAAEVPDDVWAKHYCGFSNTQTQAIFSAGLASFAGVMFLVGWLIPKIGLRTRAILGAVCLGAGYVLAGLLDPTNFPLLFVFIGLLGGAGIGLAYVVPIAIGMQWFPDKKGLITGLAVAGFGFGAMLWVKLAGSWGQLIANLGLGTTFVIYGIVFAVACLVGSIWMVKPPAGWKPAGWEPPALKADGTAAAGSVDYTLAEMLRYPQAYMIFVCFLFGAAAGLMTIGLMKLFPIEALTARGMEATAASAVAGTAMAVFFSLANGIGRIAWGAISDKLGYKLSVFLILATQGVFVILFQWMAGSTATLFLFAALIGFNFGGNFALFPVATADAFGKKYIAQNYGFVFLSYGVGGIFGPILGGRLGDLGNFPLAFTICGILCLVAAVVMAMVKPPVRSEPAPAAA